MEGPENCGGILTAGNSGDQARLGGVRSRHVRCVRAPVPSRRHTCRWGASGGPASDSSPQLPAAAAALRARVGGYRGGRGGLRAAGRLRSGGRAGREHRRLSAGRAQGQPGVGFECLGRCGGQAAAEPELAQAVRPLPDGTPVEPPKVVVRRARRSDLPALARLEVELPRHHSLAPTFSASPVPSYEECLAGWEEDFDDPAYGHERAPRGHLRDHLPAAHLPGNPALLRVSHRVHDDGSSQLFGSAALGRRGHGRDDAGGSAAPGGCAGGPSAERNGSSVRGAGAVHQ